MAAQRPGRARRLPRRLHRAFESPSQHGRGLAARRRCSRTSPIRLRVGLIRRSGPLGLRAATFSGQAEVELDRGGLVFGGRLSERTPEGRPPPRPAPAPPGSRAALASASTTAGSPGSVLEQVHGEAFSMPRPLPPRSSAARWCASASRPAGWRRRRLRARGGVHEIQRVEGRSRRPRSASASVAAVARCRQGHPDVPQRGRIRRTMATASASAELPSGRLAIVRSTAPTASA